jgi:hypothetical protein
VCRRPPAGKLLAVNTPNFWWRLRSLFGATLAGFGWTGYRPVMQLRPYPPPPWWRQIWHAFRPPPAPLLPPDFKPPPPPPWFGPPESELGVAVPLRAVLVSEPAFAIALVNCVAFSTGFEFGIAVRSREEIDHRIMGFGPPAPYGPQRPEGQLMIGVEFAGGRKATSDYNPGAQLMAYWAGVREGREQELPEGPILSPRSGGGGGRRFDFHYWVWPLPPEGKLTFTCEWPARKVALTTYEVDAEQVRRAGSGSSKLWDDDD